MCLHFVLLLELGLGIFFCTPNIFFCHFFGWQKTFFSAASCRNFTNFSPIRPHIAPSHAYIDPFFFCRHQQQMRNNEWWFVGLLFLRQKSESFPAESLEGILKPPLILHLSRWWSFTGSDKTSFSPWEEVWKMPRCESVDRGEWRQALLHCSCWAPWTRKTSFVAISAENYAWYSALLYIVVDCCCTIMQTLPFTHEFWIDFMPHSRCCEKGRRKKAIQKRGKFSVQLTSCLTLCLPSSWFFFPFFLRFKINKFL